MSEREWDRRLRVRTIGREDESAAAYSPYEPTPYRVLARLAESGYVRRKDRLLDYGCGKGRVVLFMASVVGCRTTGIDRSEKLIAATKENRRASRLGDRVTLECVSAERYGIRDENVFFFFNPFSEKIFESVLRRLARFREETPRTLTVLCYYPSEAYIQCLDAAPGAVKADEIGCGDLFGGRDPRERIVVYRFPGIVE